MITLLLFRPMTGRPWIQLAGVLLALVALSTEARPQADRPLGVPRDTTAFQHARHKTVECAECHSASRGRLKFGAAPDGCRSCHHGVAQKSACAACHATSPKPRDVPVTFTIVARKKKPPVTRPLTFRHEQHGKLVCSACHNADADRTVEKNCLSCHADHHAAARDCTSCHADARTGHKLAAHDGCANCHAGGKTPALTYTRALCLTCHDKQRTHEPGGDCATCHAVGSHVPAGGRS